MQSNPFPLLEGTEIPKVNRQSASDIAANWISILSSSGDDTTTK